MPSPFPGMDPYLEDPAVWSGFHVAFLVALQENLGPAVRPKYFVRVEERVYVAREEDPAYRLIVPDLRVTEPRQRAMTLAPSKGVSTITEPIPVAELIDPEIHEHRIEVIDRVDRSVVTVVELLSPSNKVPGSAARASFLQKRREVYASSAHWMEIDLLRAGTRAANLAPAADVEYHIYLSRAGQSRRGFVWPVRLDQKLPRVAVPLRGEDPDVPLDLQEALDHVYDRGGYDLDLDYHSDPIPPLTDRQTSWARGILHAAGG